MAPGVVPKEPLDDRDRAAGDLALVDGPDDTRLTPTAGRLGHGSGWFAYPPLGLGLQVPQTALERTVERPLERPAQHAGHQSIP